MGWSGRAFEGVLPPHPQPVSPDGGKGRILCFCCEKKTYWNHWTVER